MSKDEQPATQQETTTDEQRKAAPAPNGVLILIEEDSDGSPSLKVQTLGTQDVLSIPTILALAIKQVNEQLGI